VKSAPHDFGVSTRDSGPQEPHGQVGRAWVRRARRWLLVVGLMYAAWYCVLFFAQRSMLFPAHMTRRDFRPEFAAPAEVEVIHHEASGARVEAWLVRSSVLPAAPDCGVLVVFFHGNAELIDDNLELAQEYAGRGAHVLMPEYRGYGRSTGSPSEAALVADADALIREALQRLLEDTGQSPRIVLHGRSLGGGVAAQVAEVMRVRGEAPAGLVLESSFTSVASFAAGFGVPSAVVRDPLRTDRVIGGFAFPILIMHGSQDSVIPVAHGRGLSAKAPGAVYVEMAGGHNDFPRAEDASPYWAAIEELLARASTH
jgi:uncharacterized protein